MSFFKDHNLCGSTVLSFAFSCGLAAAAAAQDTASDEAFASMMEAMASEMTTSVVQPVAATDPSQLGAPVCLEEVTNSVALTTGTEPAHVLVSDAALAESLECMNGQVVYVTAPLTAADS